MRTQSFIMAITEGAKIGHTTSQLLPSFCFSGENRFHAFSFSSHYNH